MPGVIQPTGQIIGEEGTGLTRRPTLNFVGATVTAADNAAANRTDVTITAAAGSYPGTLFESTGGNDTAAIQAILDGFEAAGGGELIISGMCRVTGLRYDGGNLTIRGVGGAGAQVTTGDGFINTSSTTTTLDFSLNGVANSAGAASVQSNLVDGLRFTASSAMTSGWSIKAGTTFSCSTIRNCTFNGGNSFYGSAGGTKNGVYLGMGCQDVALIDNFFWYFTGTALELEGYETNATDAGTGTTYRVEGGMLGLNAYGVKYKHKDAVRFTNVDLVLNTYNMVIEADTAVTDGYGLNHLWAAFVGCTFDNGLVYITGHASNEIKHMHFESCVFLAGGIRIATNVKNIKIMGCTFMNSATVTLNSGAAHIAVHGNTFEGATTAITVASGVCDFEIIGNKHYRTSTSGSATLVSYGGSNDRFVVALNNVRAASPATAAVSSGTAGGSNTVVANNLAVAA